jgi:hypothetical protein
MLRSLLLLLCWGHVPHLRQLLLHLLLPRGARGAAALIGKLVAAAAHDKKQLRAQQNTMMSKFVGAAALTGKPAAAAAHNEKQFRAQQITR